MRIVLEVASFFIALGVTEQWIKPWAMRVANRSAQAVREAAPAVFRRLDPVLAQLLLTSPSGEDFDSRVRALFQEEHPERDWSEADLTEFYRLLDVRRVAGKAVGLPPSGDISLPPSYTEA